MDKIKVATIIWKDAIGGAERSVSDLAAALDRSRFDMRVFVLSGNSWHFTCKIQQLGYELVLLDWKNGGSIAGRRALIRELRAYSPDIIHDHIMPPLTRPLVRRLLGVPVITTEHGAAIQRMRGEGEWWRRYTERFDLSFCDCIVANSRASLDALTRVYGIHADRVRVVYLGIDLGCFQPSSSSRPPATVRRIGYVGRIINQHKGVDFLPRVARLLLDLVPHSVEFLVAGDGPDRAHTEELCAREGVGRIFKFLGWVGDVRSFLDGIDVLVVPSRYEPFGLVALEALAMNVPVVAFDVDGLREAVSGCPCAALVPPGDIEAMAEAISIVLDMDEQTKNRGRAFVEEKYANSRLAAQLQELYRELLNTGRCVCMVPNHPYKQ